MVPFQSPASLRRGVPIRAAIFVSLALLAEDIHGQVTKDQLRELLTKGLPSTVIVALLEKECTSFPIDADSLLEFRTAPKEVLEALVRCQPRSASGNSAAQSDRPPGRIAISFLKEGQDKDGEAWGAFVWYFFKSSMVIGRALQQGSEDASAEIALFFSVDSGQPAETLSEYLAGRHVSAVLVSGSRQDRVSWARPCLLGTCWATMMGVFWAPERGSVELEVAPGTHELRVDTLARELGKPWQVWRIEPDEAHLCPGASRSASIPISIAAGETRPVTLVVRAQKSEGKLPGSNKYTPVICNYVAIH